MRIRLLGILMVLGLHSAFAVAVRDFSRMTREEAQRGETCHLRGLITKVVSAEKGNYIVADERDPNGVAVFVGKESEETPLPEIVNATHLKEGDVVEIDGQIAPLVFSPGVFAKRIEKVGAMGLAVPPVYDLRELAGGAFDNRRVTLRGVLVECRDLDRLTVLTADGAFSAFIGCDSEQWRPLVDSEIEISGVALSYFNLKSEFIGVHLHAVAPSDVHVLKPNKNGPWDAKRYSVGSALAYRPGAQDFHRRQVEGVVTYVGKDRRATLQDGEDAIRVRFVDGALPQVGERVLVAGFPVLRSNRMQLDYAQWKRIGKGEVPVLSIGGDEIEDVVTLKRSSISMRDLDAKVLRIKGRFKHLDEMSDGSRTLIVDLDGFVASVKLVFDGPFESDFLEALEFSPLLELTGVCLVNLKDEPPQYWLPMPESFILALRSPDDLLIVPDAEFAGRKRAALVRQGFKVFFAAVVFVALVLALVSFRQRQKRLAIEAVQSERQRMAGDLHDTIEQHLAGAKMLLKSANEMEGVPAEAREAMDAAAEVMAQAKAEMRQTVYNLHHDEIFAKSPEVLLKEVSRKANKSGVKVRYALRGLPAHLPGAVLADMMYILGEAMTNAVKHGKAKTIALTSDPVAGGFVLKIANDGEPFDSAAVLGPSLGHFGLYGMRERARRSGIKIAFVAEGKWMTVRLEVAI